VKATKPIYKARYWHALPDCRIECEVCPRHCHLRDGQVGFCFVRRNTGGVMDLATYGRTSGLAIDPIEKKPIYHMSPGSHVLSLGTAGCSYACRFCQNWRISTARAMDVLSVTAPPELLAHAAQLRDCRGIAYTYNEPTIYPEYAIDTAVAAHELGLLNIAVTAGSILPPAREDFFAPMDAANVDLKSFNPDFYRKLVGGRLTVVLDTLKYLVHETNVWVELTTLVIPHQNDSDTEIEQLATWVATELGPDVPLHLSAFHPSHRMLDATPTSPVTLRRAREIAMDQGLRYVYTGNITDQEGSTTFCPNCGQELVVRRGFRVAEMHMTNEGLCQYCDTPIPGHWGASPPSH